MQDTSNSPLSAFLSQVDSKPQKAAFSVESCQGQGARLVQLRIHAKDMEFSWPSDDGFPEQGGEPVGKEVKGRGLLESRSPAFI